jgi:hypothetical protein
VIAQIPASDLTASGTAAITIQNPAPGGGVSSSLTFNDPLMLTGALSCPSLLNYTAASG